MTDLHVSVVSQAQASRADVPHRWSPQHPHNLGCAATVIRNRQDMSHPSRQLPQVPCTWMHFEGSQLSLSTVHVSSFRVWQDSQPAGAMTSGTCLLHY